MILRECSNQKIPVSEHLKLVLGKFVSFLTSLAIFSFPYIDKHLGSIKSSLLSDAQSLKQSILYL